MCFIKESIPGFDVAIQCNQEKTDPEQFSYCAGKKDVLGMVEHVKGRLYPDWGKKKSSCLSLEGR